MKKSDIDNIKDIIDKSIDADELYEEIKKMCKEYDERNKKEYLTYKLKKSFKEFEFSDQEDKKLLRESIDSLKVVNFNQKSIEATCSEPNISFVWWFSGWKADSWRISIICGDERFEFNNSNIDKDDLSNLFELCEPKFSKKLFYKFVDHIVNCFDYTDL